MLVNFGRRKQKSYEWVGVSNMVKEKEKNPTKPFLLDEHVSSPFQLRIMNSG